MLILARCYRVSRQLDNIRIYDIDKNLQRPKIHLFAKFLLLYKFLFFFILFLEFLKLVVAEGELSVAPLDLPHFCLQVSLLITSHLWKCYVKWSHLENYWHTLWSCHLISAVWYTALNSLQQWLSESVIMLRLGISSKQKSSFSVQYSHLTMSIKGTSTDFINPNVSLNAFHY